MNPKVIRSASRRASEGALAKPLSPLAAFVRKHADGTRSVLDLVELAATALSRPVRREEVFLACDELADLGLLEARVAPPAGRAKTIPRKAVATGKKKAQEKKAAPRTEEQLEKQRKNDATVARKEQRQQHVAASGTDRSTKRKVTQ